MLNFEAFLGMCFIRLVLAYPLLINFWIIILRIFKELSEFLAGRFNFLCLESCFYYVQWIGNKASYPTSSARTYEIPKQWSTLVPGLYIRFEIFIHTNDGCRIRNIHTYSDRI